MARFPEAEARRLKNIFVCRKCKTKRRVAGTLVLAGKVSCRRCGCKALRPVRKK